MNLRPLLVGVLILGPALGASAARHYLPATEPEFVPPAFTSPAVSPDGTAVAFIAQSEGHSRLFQLDLKTHAVTGIFSAGDGEVQTFWWLGSHRVLIAAVGESDLSYFVQDLDGSKPRRVALLDHSPPEWVLPIVGDAEHVTATLMDFYRGPLTASSSLDPGAGQNDRYVARVNVLRNSAVRLDTLEHDDSGWDWNSRGARLTTLRPSAALFQVVVSTHGELLARSSSLHGRWHVTWRATVEAPWHELRGESDLPPFVPIAVDSADRLLVLANDQADTSALMRLDGDSGQRTLLAQRPDRDIASLIASPSGTGSVAGVTFYSHEGEDVLYLDQTETTFHQQLARSFPGLAVRVVSTSREGGQSVVSTWSATTAPAYYLFDRAAGRLSFLGQERPSADPAHGAHVQVVHFQAADGTALTGHALVPVQHSAQGAALLVAPLQFVGEPAITPDTYSAAEMYLVRRGIAVAHFSVAGTTGFGTALRRAGNFQLAGRTSRDLEAGVRALLRTGEIDPGRVAVYGEWLGSMFSLHLAAQSPLYRAAIVKFPQLPRTTSAIPWMSGDNAPLETLIERAGGSQAAFALVNEFDPASFVARLRSPVFVLYHPQGPVSAGALRRQLDQAKVPNTWVDISSPTDSLRREREDQDAYVQIADFLLAPVAPR